MNKKILCAIPLSLLAVACGHQAATTFPGCVDPPISVSCTPTGTGTTRKVKVTPKGWVVVPTNACVTAGDSIEIHFLGRARTPNTLATVPHGNSEFWLIGNNSSEGNKITLTVPAGPEKGTSFDYAILSKSDGCVDPRFTYD